VRLIISNQESIRSNIPYVEKFCWISIQSPDEPFAPTPDPIPENLVARKNMHIADVNSAEYSAFDGYFHEGMAGELWDFINHYESQCDVLFINCYHGRSRSRAIGAAYLFCAAKETELARGMFMAHNPNTHVFATMVKVWLDRHQALREHDINKEYEAYLYEKRRNQDGGA
jgi:predicted protein tyrosine phosphatase